MRRVLLLVLVLLAGACSESPIGPEPEGPEITGEPCSTASPDCRVVTAHQLSASAWALWSQPHPPDGTPAAICPVTAATLDVARFGTRWRCEWALVAMHP